MILGAGEQGFLMGFRELKAQVFGEELFVFRVDLMEGDIEGGHYSGFVMGPGDQIILGVVELEIDEVVDIGGARVSEVIKLIEVRGVGFKLVVLDLRGNEVDVVAAQVTVAPESCNLYTSLMWASASGMYLSEMI